MSTAVIPITNDPDANRLLEEDPLALLLGMLLDQQITMELAFAGPKKLLDRLGHLDPARIAAMAPEEFIEVCRTKPAIHRFPKSMGERIQAVCDHVADRYGGDASRLWRDASDGQDLYDRLRDVPGYGDEKAKIFVAILAKRFGITLDGWHEVAAPFSDDVPRSVADIGSAEALAEVRAWKKAQKAARKSKQD